ncbi:unnamed protein product [Strongylus vulgaris]|uniref:Uncharacterized protein n=1 Tax=Strongylus vulgaris TaxID=40348 RepID=A0A3P7IZJ1_STRVU|nr:unnamed protein product [Strongylus vulgaris]
MFYQLFTVLMHLRMKFLLMSLYPMIGQFIYNLELLCDLLMTLDLSSMVS